MNKINRDIFSESAYFFPTYFVTFPASLASVRILRIFWPLFHACFWSFLFVKKGNFSHKEFMKHMKLVLGDKVECFVLLCQVSWKSVVVAKCGPTFCASTEHPHTGGIQADRLYGFCVGQRCLVTLYK